MRSLLLALALLAGAAHAAPHHIEIKGVRAGDPIDKMTIALAFGRDLFTPLAGVWCEITINPGEPAGDPDLDTLLATFKPEGFADLDAALRAKYGDPAIIQHARLVNGFGASVDNTVEIWRDEEGNELTLDHYGDLRTGVLHMQSARSVARSARERSQAKGRI